MADANNNADRVVISFFTDALLDHAESERKGRPIFRDVEMIQFNFAGDNKRVCVFPATETDPNATREAGYPVSYAESYGDQYRKFKAGQQQTVNGTPLSEAPFLTEGKRRELRALNVHSVEALAALDGPNLKTLGMGGRDLKNQATAYLERAAGSADVTGMAGKISKLEETVAMLMEENARLAQGSAKTAKEPGKAAVTDDTKSIDECSDEELRSFITENGGKVAHNAGRARLIELATELASKPETEAA
jgi:hypothetical protein